MARSSLFVQRLGNTGVASCGRIPRSAATEEGKDAGHCRPHSGRSRSLAAAISVSTFLGNSSRQQRLLGESRFAGSDYEELGDEPLGAHVEIAQRSQNAAPLPWLSWAQVQVDCGEIDVFAHPLQAPLE